MFKKRQKPTAAAKQDQEKDLPDADGGSKAGPGVAEQEDGPASKRHAIGRGATRNPESSNAVKLNQFGAGGNTKAAPQGGAMQLGGSSSSTRSGGNGLALDLLGGRTVQEAEGEIFAVTSEFGILDEAGNSATAARTGAAFATRETFVDADKSQDQRAINERNAKIKKDLDAGNLDTGVYRGLNARKDYIGKSADAISKSKISGTMGPVRANTTIRSTARFDYWGTSGDGGVCKEYLQTGFCGYGDACIHMHDRFELKQGWKLDREWEEEQKKKQLKLQKRLERCRAVDAGEEISSDESSDDEDAMKRQMNEEDRKLMMPDRCGVCKKTWDELGSVPPTSTNCDHYFCESCIMAHWKKSRKCPQCSKPLNGIFNNCEDQWEKWKKRKQQLRDERRSALEGGTRRTSGVEALIGIKGVAY
ncbi:unnamed protein product [Amoebophrya sp. A25]|nr:unnamed protein product [Amoebophrya sp. A25]|eukprot:GSA25T00020047001.1